MNLALLEMVPHFILGLIAGSFLNVCIYRLPREESVVWPSSRCPKCQKLIRWHDNIPVLSFLLLRGRCRDCKGRISFRYAAVELLTASAFVWAWFQFGLSVQAGVALLLFSLLLVTTFVDFEHQIIPDEVSLGGLGAGLVLSAVFPRLHAETVWWRGLADSVIGALAGGGMIYATGVVGNLIFRKESMGGGDVKLLAMLGAFLGWRQAVLIYLTAPILALPLGLFLKFAKRVELIPYGPFLSLAGWISFLWGEPLLNWYWYGMKF